MRSIPVTSIQFLPAFPNGDNPAVRLTGVAIPRARATPLFGAHLKELREKRLGKRKSLQTVVDRLADLGFKDVSTTTIWRYEKGRAPDVAILWGLTEIYRADFAQLVQSLASELAGRPVAAATTEATRLSDEERWIVDTYNGLTEMSDKEAFLTTVDLFRLRAARPASVQSESAPAPDMPATAAGNRGRSRRSQRTD